MNRANQEIHQDETLAVYNSRNPEMLSSSRLRWLCCALLVVCQMAFAADWRTPETQLVGKIAAATGPGVIALEVNNRSSISSADVEAIRRALISDLAGSGIRVWNPDQAAALVKVTLSENLQNYVWVAEIQQGTGEPSLIMISAPRPESTPNSQNAWPLTLHVTPLVSSPEPILDAAVLEGSPRRVLALGAGGVAIYDFKDNRWVQAQELAIAHSHPFPRDLRGRIILRNDHLFDAYLPGLVCHSTNAAPLAITCLPSDDPWPLQTPDFAVSAFFSPAQNFFTGALAPGIGKQKAAPPFYSAAAIPREKYALWIVAGFDRQLHLLDGINQQTLGNVHWGSDIAGVHAECRPTWQVLATASGDETTDSLQAFEFPDRQPVAVSQKLELNGRFTALWTAQNGQSAVAVYRDADSGNYEAIQLNLACSQ
jgi:hypothetical protein